jgi:hypothetical protein
MFKTISICATVVVLGTAAANAQQQEAILQAVELPGTGIDIVLAMPKSAGATIDLAKSPDALVMHLTGGKLALAFDTEAEMLTAFDSLRKPGCNFRTTGTSPTVQKPVSVYVVPHRTAPTVIQLASFKTPPPEPRMHKVEVPGGTFDIVFSTARALPALNPDELLDAVAVYSIGSQFAMATVGEVEKTFRDVGHSELPVCAFEVEHKDSNPPQATSVYIFSKS